MKSSTVLILFVGISLSGFAQQHATFTLKEDTIELTGRIKNRTGQNLQIVIVLRDRSITFFK